MEKSDHHPIPADDNTPSSWNSDVGFSDRRYAFARQATPIPTGPFLSRTASTIDMPPATDILEKEMRASSFPLPAFSMLRSASKPMKKLFLMISFNVAYSTVELLLGLFTGRIGLVSDAFHLTFGCGLLTFSLFAMAVSRKKADRFYTYGYKRLEVLSAFTNALFLLFMSFSIAVEALHAFIQDEDEHKHYLVISAVVNLLVNLVGVWFFRNYARITIGEPAGGWKEVPAHDPEVQIAANHAVKSIQQRSNSLAPYILQEIVHAKAEVNEGLAKFDILLNVKRGNKEEKYKVLVHKNNEGSFHLNHMEHHQD